MMGKQAVYHIVNGKRECIGYRQLKEYQPVLLVGLICGRWLPDGSKCNGRLASFERDSSTGVFHLRQAEPMHFLSDGNADARKASYRNELDWRRGLRLSGMADGTPHDRTPGAYPCPLCGKSWKYNDDKLCANIKKVADYYQALRYEQWHDSAVVLFTDPHSGGMRYPHIYISSLFEHAR